jgi:hypothetical protein
MAVAEAAGRRVEEKAPSTARTRGRVFGIELDTDTPVWPSSARYTVAPGRRTVVEAVGRDWLDEVWRSAEAVRVLERLFPNGRPGLTVDHDPELGYRVWACRMGCHLVSPDGREVASVPSRLPPWVWQRLLFGQVLPLAATLHGLELVHASSVVLGGRTVAFTAHSGTGKTSVAAHLVAAGASLLTDDVLALEVVDGGRLLAHPGGPIFAVAASELEAMGPEGRRRLGDPAGRGDKVMVRARLATQASCLDALYFLERSNAPGALTIDRLRPDPLRPLARSFNSYVRSHERVVNQLAVCAALTESVQMFSVVVPLSCPATAVAAAVEAHAEENR